MAETPRDRMKRQPNRLRNPHAGESLEPTLTRQGLLARPGSLAIGFAALCFFAYAFDFAGLQTATDGLLGGLNATVRSRNNDVASWFVGALPYIGMALFGMLLFIVLGKLGGGPRPAASPSSETKKAGRTSLEDFVKMAAQQKVSERVAREAYSLLAPRYGKAAIGINDSLATRLGMAPNQIADMQGTLMRYTDRQIRAGMSDADIETVLELMLSVELSTVRSVPRQGAPVAQAKEPVLRTLAPEKPQRNDVAAKPSVAAFVRPYRPAKAESQSTVVATNAAHFTASGR